MVAEGVVIRDQDSFQFKADGRTRHQADTETMAVVVDVIITEVTSVDEVRDWPALGVYISTNVSIIFQGVADTDGGNVNLEKFCQLFKNSNFPSFRQFNGSPFRQITITIIHSFYSV